MSLSNQDRGTLVQKYLGKAWSTLDDANRRLLCIQRFLLRMRGISGWFPYYVFLVENKYTDSQPFLLHLYFFFSKLHASSIPPFAR